MKKKQGINTGRVKKDAFERYAKDIANTDLSFSEKQQEILSKQNSPAERLVPQVLPNTPLSSIQMAEFVRDCKLKFALLSGQSFQLEKEVENSTQSMLSQLDDIGHQLRTISSDISELESKANGKYTRVHYNEFTRPVDMGIKQNSFTDPKTNQVFGPEHKLKLLSGTGLTLPLTHREKVQIKRITIVDETTTVGDFSQPILRTDCNELLRNKPFRYIIGKKAYDSSERLINHTDNFLTLRLELGYLQVVNQLVIKVGSASTLQIESARCINESNESILIDIDSINLKTDVVLCFEPLRASSFVIKFRQCASADVAELINSEDSAIAEILQGSGFNILNDNSMPMTVKVYDFSIQGIQASLCSYEQQGYFFSKEVSVDKPLSIAMTLDVHPISVSNPLQNYGDENFLPADTVFSETYVKAILRNKQKELQCNTIFPVPTTKSNQIELAPLIGDVATFCFLPDLFWTVTKLLPVISTKLGLYVVLYFDAPHGIPTGTVYNDLVEVSGGEDFSITSTLWQASSSTTLILVRDDATAEYYVYGPDHSPTIEFLRYNASQPFEVFSDTDEQVVGTDFEFSIDGGATYYNRNLTRAEFRAAKDIHAGDFKIKVYNPSDDFYWCNYKRLNDQYLEASKLFRLKGSSVIVNPKLRDTSGSLQTAVILRSDSVTPYLSSVVNNYQLKVREYES